MKKVLVIDDEDAICTLCADELTNDGYEVITTGDCAGLMELIGQQGPDLIVLDIRMGEYNGLDLLQDIRNTYHNMPVILHTAYSAFKSDLKSVAADYYVVKSADLIDLRHTIKTAIEV